MVDQEDEAVTLRKEFYDMVNLIVNRNELIDLNMESMNLGNEAVLLCESLVGNKSLVAVHLGHNGIDEKTIGKIKWYLSIGIPDKAVMDTKRQSSDSESSSSSSEEIEMDFDWFGVANKIPVGLNEVDVKARKKLWKVFESNGNGYISFREAIRGLRESDLHEWTKHELKVAKPALKSAFNFAQAAEKAEVNDKYGDDYVERKEFRVFLLALAQRFEYWHAFTIIDANHDGRIGLEEFKAAKSKIEKWVGKIDDVEEEFSAIDTNGGGLIFFDEFCDWSVRKCLSLERE